MMLYRLIHFVARRCRARDITGPDGTLYMRRYCIFGWLPGDKPKMFSLYLHRFTREDEDRELHNHPWTFAVSLILTGGYEEELLDWTDLPLPPSTEEPDARRRHFIFKKTVTRKPGRLNFLLGNSFHRVHKLLGKTTRDNDGEVWTLFFCGPKRKTSWGFLTKHGYMHRSEYFASKGMTVGT
jgi:hypothetical protein